MENLLYKGDTIKICHTIKICRFGLSQALCSNTTTQGTNDIKVVSIFDFVQCFLVSLYGT